MDRPTHILSSLAFVLLTANGGDEAQSARRAYADGRFAEAAKAFAAAEAEAGDDASPELLFNHALAALRAEHLTEAEAAAEKSAARGGGEFAGLRDFIAGSAAFARCVKAEYGADMPEAGPSEMDTAIAYAEAARKAWTRAVASRTDWPEARRNAERALLKLESLRLKKAEADKKRGPDKKVGQKQINPRPVPTKPDPATPRDDKSNIPKPATPKGDGSRNDAKTEAQTTALSPGQVKSLLERLEAKEKQKVTLRRAERDARATSTERDW